MKIAGRATEKRALCFRDGRLLTEKGVRANQSMMPKSRYGLDDNLLYLKGSRGFPTQPARPSESTLATSSEIQEGAPVDRSELPSDTAFGFYGRQAERGNAMGILLAFAPFIVFAIVERFVGPTEGLVSAAIVSAALLARDALTPGRAPKILEIGTLVLFGGLALYALLGGPSWSVIGVRLCVDAGLLAIVLISMIVGRPFTLQYARERVAPELWHSPRFLRTNYVITAAWALAFAIMVIAELALLIMPEMPRRLGVIAIVAALVGAVKFTGWYPERVGARSRS